MNPYIAIAALLAAFVVADYAYRLYKRLRHQLKCATCGRAVLQVVWRDGQTSCCLMHACQRTSATTSPTYRPPQLRRLEDPLRQPRPNTWPACPNCLHLIPGLEPPPPRSSSSSSLAGTPEEAALISSRKH